MLGNISYNPNSAIGQLETDIVSLTSFTSNVYLKALIIFVSFFVLSKLVVWVSETIILQLTKRTKTDIDDLIVQELNGPLSWILLVFGVRFAIMPFTLNQTLEGVIILAIYSVILMIASKAGIGVVGILLHHGTKAFVSRTKSTIDDQLADLTHKTVKVILVIICILLILNLWGVETGPLLAGLGIGGIAVALALQPTLANIFGGVALILDKTLQVGDVVEIEQFSGKIMEIGIRSTKIKTWDNEVVIIPNGKLVDTTIKNRSKPDASIRVVVPFSISYESDVQKAKKIVLSLVKEVNGLRKDKEPWIWFQEMGASSLNMKLYFFVESTGKKMPAIDFMNTNIHAAFKKAKIEIPFPQMEIKMRR